MNNQQLYFDSFGQPARVIQMKDKQLTSLNEGEILVEMLYAPINPSDLIPITGAYAHRTFLPSLIGYEGVGLVRRVHNESDKHLLNKRVLPLRGEGTWQKFVVTQADYAIVVPEEIDSITASQAYINPVTAWVLCVEEFKLKKDDFLIINAANSSIGKSFIQLAKILGFKLIGVVRNEKARKELEKLSLFFVVNSAKENIKATVTKITNKKGVQAAVDSIGGQQGNILAECVTAGGKFRTIGLLSGEQVDWQFLTTQLDISVEIFHLRHWLDRITNAKWQQTFTEIFYYLKSGLWHLPRPSAFYSLIQFKQAIADFEQSGKNGKVLFDFCDNIKA